MTDTTESIAKEFREYAYSVSHDLGAPVRAMVEFSKILNSDYATALDDEAKLYLSMVVESGQKLQKMMEGLLVYSRLDTEPFVAMPVECAPLLQQCLADLQPQITQTQAVIEIGSLPVVQGHSERLQRLFHSLLQNALTFVAAGVVPHVSISAQAQGEHWLFSIADNGIGIAAHHYERVVKLFQRLHTDEEYPGIGMGLCLARKIIQQHGGMLAFQPNEGQGMICQFTLPAVKES